MPEIPEQQKNLIKNTQELGNAFKVDPSLHKLMDPTKYEVKPTDTFRIEFGLKEKDGRMIIVENSDPLERVEKHWCEFKVWNFREATEMKKMATSFDDKRNFATIDIERLNEIKIRRLLKDWSFAYKNEKFKIASVNGVMADSTWELFSKMSYCVSAYIIDRMNGVLEHNE